MNNRMSKNTRIWLVIVILIVVAVAAALWAEATWFRPPPPFVRRVPPPTGIPGDYELFYTAEAVISTVNITLSFLLVLIYVSIYLKTRSQFTIGLIVFLSAFFLDAIASSPFITRAFGFHAFGLGPFALLPSVFTLGALAVLLYLSVKY
jgi:hypothetical protein